MSELAFNINGEPFDTGDATTWRVRRVRDRGLEVVYRRNGCTPIYLPIATTSEDEFQREVDYEEAKYRLDALLEDGQPAEGVPAAYVMVRRRESATTSTPTSVPTATAGSSAPVGATEPKAPRRGMEMSETGELLRMAVKANAKTTRVIAKQYASVLDAAARVLSADGANLPARQAFEQQRNAAHLIDPATAIIDDDSLDDDDEDEDEEAGLLDRIMNLAEDYAPVARRAFGIEDDKPPRNAARNGKGKPSKPQASGTRTRPATTSSTSPKAGPAGDTSDPSPKEGSAPVDDGPLEASPASDAAPGTPSKAPKMTPPMMVHLMKIKKHLTKDEVRFITELYKELTSEEVAEFMSQLSGLTVDEAVAEIRARIAGETNTTQEDDDQDNSNDDNDEKEVSHGA